MLNFIKKIFYYFKQLYVLDITSAKHPNQDDSLAPELLSELRKFKRITLKKGLILYHGSREYSYFTEYKNRSLTGTRKWFSEDKYNAINYAFCDRHRDLGKRLLWKIKLTEDIICLHGRQVKLMPFSPWNVEFPFKFPDNFSIYANEILGVQVSHALVDHFNNGIFLEILLTNHMNSIEVLDVTQLPNNKDKAIKFMEVLKTNG